MTKPKILPCPLCGGEQIERDKGTVWVGPQSATSQGVSCERCCLYVIERLKEWSPGMPRSVKKAGANAMLRWEEQQMLLRALERWNKLPRKGGEP